MAYAPLSNKRSKRKRKPKAEPKKGSPLIVIAKAAVFVVLIGALLRGLELLIGNPMSGALLGAVGVSLLSGRLGVRSEEGGHGARRRALLGAASAAAVAAACLITSLALGGALELTGPSLPTLFGVAEAGALSYRDELWLHGIALVYAQRAGVPRWAAFLFGVAASVAVVALRPGINPASMALVVGSSAFFMLLWLRTRDAWAPVAAHFAWAWCSESLLNGDLLDLVSPAGRMARGLGAAGTVGWVAAAGVCVLTLLLFRNVIRIDAADPKAIEAT